ncbi:MAG: ADOP family duplicated permease [Candidatus Acidiferrales bacterium]
MSVWRRWFGRDTWEREMNEELRFHVEQQTAANIAAGIAPKEARRQATVQFGGAEGVKEDCREQRRGFWLETLWADARYSLRMLRRSPGFTIIAVLTLALGIGANTAVFSVVDAVLLKPLPYRDPGRLVVVWESKQNPHNAVSPPDFLDWRARNSVFEDMAYLADQHVNLTVNGLPEQVDLQKVAANFFDVLGVPPALGPGFTSINGQAGNDKLVILNYALWRGSFGSDPNIIGKRIQINGTGYAIVGVTPPNFDSFIPAGSLTGEHPQMWASFAFPSSFKDRSKVGRFLTVIARLKPGVNSGRAQAQMSVISAALAQTYPENDGGWRATIVPMQEEITGDMRPALLILLGAVGLVLLIACANLSSLLLSRTPGRRREIAVRTAIGGSRWRIARQLLAESMVLAVIGGSLGIFAAVCGAHALLRTTPRGLLNVPDIPVDTRVLLFTAGITLLAAILFGFLPSYVSAHSEIAASLQDAGRTSSQSRRSRTAHKVFIVAEIALALVLLAGSGLLVQSFVRLVRVNPGFDARNLLTFKLDLPDTKYKDDETRIAFFNELLDNLSHLPGVRSATAENLPPFSGFSAWGVATDVLLPGQTAQVPESQRATTAVRVVAADYFRTMKLPLREGRTFVPAEFAAERHVVIVNEVFAKKFLPKTNPIGQKITIDMKDQNVPSEIVGVVADVHEANLGVLPWPTAYWPYPELPYSSMSVVVRTATNPLTLVFPARDTVLRMDKDEPISDVATMDRLLSNSVARSRFTMQLFSIFAALALLLASIGIYGVISYSVAQRTREIGIRMALGAQRRDVLRIVVGDGARLAFLGIVIGVAGGLALTRVMTNLLFEVKPTDPAIFAVAAILLAIVALAACYIPARRAMRVDPMVALRYE